MHVEFEMKHPKESSDEEPWGIRLEVIITVLLGIAAITAAFAAFRSEQLKSDANSRLYAGQLAETEFVANNSNASAHSTIDQVQFLDYERAMASHDSALANRIFGFMNPNLQKVVNQYDPPPRLAFTGPCESPCPDLAQAPELNQGLNAPFTSVAGATRPLAATVYTGSLQGAKAANEAAKRAREDAHEGLTVSDRSDRFARIEIVIATALFLYGIAAVSRRMKVKIGALGLGVVVFSFAVVSLALA